MNGTAKIRFVRCPKCLHVLPEFPDIPVYKCGNCETQLQAKVRKNDSGTTLPSSGELDGAQMNKFVNGVNGTEDKLDDDKTLHPVEFSVDKSGGTDLVTSDNCNGEQLSDIKSPSGDHRNGGGHDESEEFDVDGLGGLILSNKSLNNGKDDGKLGDSSDEHARGINLTNEDLKTNGNESETCNSNVEQPGISTEACSSDGFGEAENEKLFPVARKQDDIELNGDSSQSAKPDADNQSAGVIDQTNGVTLSMISHHPAGEGILSDCPASSSGEQLHEDAQHIMNLEKFVDTSETIDYVNPSSELSGTLIDLSKSPTTSSSRAYYDDGISSNDATDDQLPDRRRNSFRSTYKPPNLVDSNERPRRERFLVSSDSKVQHRFKNQSPTFSDEIHDAIKANRLNQDGGYNPEGVGHPKQWRRREDKNPPHVSFCHDELLAGYESGSPSNQLRNQYQWMSNFNHHDKLPYHLEEKMKLLRIAHELHEQLNTRYCLNEIANEQASAGAKWESRHVPTYYGREDLDRKIYQYCECCRLPFPEHVTNSRQHVDRSWCCCSEDSALPPIPIRLHDMGYCRIHSGVKCYSSHGSCSSSPKRQMEFTTPTYIRGTSSNDLGDGDYELNKRKKEKQPSVKRYLWPIAGAAPFITCSFCRKLLQLPADFLLFRKRCHRLKCGACEKTLEFSLIGRSYLIPYEPVLQAPPPSEVGEYNGSVSRTRLASSSDVHDLPQVHPASHSDDSVNPVDKGRVVDDNAGKVSRGSLGYDERGKKPVLSVSENKYRYLDQAHGSARHSNSVSRSKRIFSQNVDGAMRGGLPLHRLMGYSSPGRVIFGYGGASSSGASPYHRQGEFD